MAKDSQSFDKIVVSRAGRQWLPVERALYGSLSQLLEIPRSGGPAKLPLLTLMVSGGVDSVALVLAFSRLKDLAGLDLKLQVVHVHHGVRDQSATVAKFRNDSRDLVIQVCKNEKLKLKIFINKGSGLLSESEARALRLQVVKRLRQESAEQIFVWGHHRDDLLETRFMRLMRGVGESGLVAMSEFNKGQFRPWLSLTRKELECYLTSYGVRAMKDPQNQDLRSWLREVLFPMLEIKRPGSTKVIGRSLEALASVKMSLQVGDGQHLEFADNCLDRPLFLGLSAQEKGRVLACYFRFLGRKNYTQGQIKEIIKRLDNPRKVHRFRVAGLDWTINAQQIRALPAAK